MPDGPLNSDDLRERLDRLLGEGVLIERELGGGGMARVFLATERALDRRIVVKTLDLEGAIAASADRFRREIRLVAQLQHPHIVPVFAAGGDETLLWYTMPYVSGESLRARLSREGALPVADAVRITREVLDALGTAHARGIVHRDIKPENILLEGTHAQVADFGVAKALAEAGVHTSLTAAGLALGTPAYMAPEQAMADPTTNHRADLYAVGAVLFEMLVGAPPFGGSAQAVVAAHLTAPVPQVADRRRDVPPPVALLATRLLAKNPAERPQTAIEAMALLEGVTTPPEMVRATRARSRAPLIAAGALGIALVAVAAWGIATRESAPDFASGAEVIAVMPFGSTGDSALARLGRDLVATMSANIDGVGSVRTVDAMSVLQRAAALPQPVALDAARRLGSSLGATYLIHGSIVHDAAEVRVDAALFDVAGSEPLARFRASAPVTGLRELTDSLSAELLRQVWRRGTPPSPMLADVATPSGEALRAFLEGEAAFEAFDVTGALAAYDRATQLDSNFVQAWLRKAHVRSAAVLPADSVTTRRLSELVDRMPERDRALRLRFPPEATFEERLAAWEAVAARFPEYHMAQYRVSDLIIHTGPLHGVPVTRALPYLDRLDSLAPRHADNAQHRLMVAAATGDTAQVLESATRFVDLAAMQRWMRNVAIAANAYQKTGNLLDAATATEVMQAAVEDMRSLPIVGELALILPPVYTAPAQAESAYVALASSPLLRGFERQYLLGLGSTQFSRGDVPSALETLSRLEAMNAPDDYRTAAVRSAATAAWLGLIPQADAEAQMTRSRRALGDATDVIKYDVLWSEAVLAIAAQDSGRFVDAVRQIADTVPGRQRAARGLRALWRERRQGQADSLIAYEDDVMRMPGVVQRNTSLARLAIGRSLTLGGDPRRAERYLQWTDASPVDRRSLQILRAMGPYSSYERGIAAEAAGDRGAAIMHLRRFVTFVDRPPPNLRNQVEDAKARLARLLTRGG
ncbi:MAG TPA: serine/threonine-protein kinase [Gemmatimonadaceae bacterium]